MASHKSRLRKLEKVLLTVGDNTIEELKTHDGCDSIRWPAGNWETLRFLLSNSRWWIDEYKFDGYRFDGVTSMMYHHHGLQMAFTGTAPGSQILACSMGICWSQREQESPIGKRLGITERSVLLCFANKILGEFPMICVMVCFDKQKRTLHTVGGYDEYFGPATDVEAVVYMMIMNQMLHDLFPTVVTVGEDVSGMPTFSR